MFHPELGDYDHRVVPHAELEGKAERNSPELLKVFCSILASLSYDGEFYDFIKLFERLAEDDKPIFIPKDNPFYRFIPAMISTQIIEVTKFGGADIHHFTGYGARLFKNAYTPFKLLWAKKHFEQNKFRSANIDPTPELKVSKKRKKHAPTPEQEVHAHFSRYAIISIREFSEKNGISIGPQTSDDIVRTYIDASRRQAELLVDNSAEDSIN